MVYKFDGRSYHWRIIQLNSKSHIFLHHHWRLLCVPILNCAKYVQNINWDVNASNEEEKCCNDKKFKPKSYTCDLEVENDCWEAPDRTKHYRKFLIVFTLFILGIESLKVLSYHPDTKDNYWANPLSLLLQNDERQKAQWNEGSLHQ